MVFGTFDEFNLYFNDKPIDRVNIYKYLGNLFNEISRAGCDIFRDNAKYIASQGRKAMFNIQKKLSNFGDVPPKLKLHIYESMIQPILLYGSDIWGYNKNATGPADKVMLQYLRCIMRVNLSDFPFQSVPLFVLAYFVCRNAFGTKTWNASL